MGAPLSAVGRANHASSLLALTLALCVLAGLASQAAATTEARIVGGVPAPVGRYPWQVQVLPGGSICGGTLISDRVVLTAAHCTNGLTAVDIQVHVGQYYYFDEDGPFEARNVAQLIQHPAYNSDSYDSDIALLVLDQPVDYPAINLAPADQPLEGGRMLRVIGWGNVNNAGDSPNELMEVDVPIADKNFCNEDWGGQVTDTQFCAGYGKAIGKDSCKGDSGGPLFSVGEDSTGKDDVQFGVVSYGSATSGCGSAIPGVYASVPYFRSWIDGHLKELNQCPDSCLSPNKKGECVPKKKNTECLTAADEEGLCRRGTCKAICELGAPCGKSSPCLCPIRAGVQCIEGVCQGPEPCSPFTLVLTWGEGADPAPTRILSLIVTDPEGTTLPSDSGDLAAYAYADVAMEGKYKFTVDYSDASGGLEDVEYTVVKEDADGSSQVLVPPTSTGTGAGAKTRSLLVGACEAK